jgi:hypothetical protein
MTDRSMTEDRVTDTQPDAHPTSHDEATASTIAWLESEFPGWTVEVDATSTWEGDLRALWIARREGHHPQAEMSPAKLHTRLDDYLSRIEQRQAMSN